MVGASWSRQGRHNVTNIGWATGVSNGDGTSSWIIRADNNGDAAPDFELHIALNGAGLNTDDLTL